MAHIEKRTTIAAPAETIFAILLDFARAPEWFDGMQEVRNVSGAGLNASFEWTFKMLGVPYSGRTTVTGLDQGRWLHQEGSGQISNSLDWTLEERGDGQTDLRLVIDYSIPGSIFGKIADKLFIERENDHAADRTLANLRARATG